MYVNKWDDVICAVNLCIFKAVNSLEIAILLNRNQCNTFWEFITWFCIQFKKSKLTWVIVKFKEI